jgi:hypothetical protein
MAVLIGSRESISLFTLFPWKIGKVIASNGPEGPCSERIIVAADQ